MIYEPYSYIAICSVPSFHSFQRLILHLSPTAIYIRLRDCPVSRSPKSSQDGQDGLWTMLGSVPLVKYGPKPKDRGLRKLLERGSGEDDKRQSRKEAARGEGGSRASSKRGSYISFWKPEVSGIMCTRVAPSLPVRCEAIALLFCVGYHHQKVGRAVPLLQGP